MTTLQNTQEAPFPTLLQELIVNLEYKSSWHFGLKHIDRGQESIGLTLTIDITCPNSYNPSELRRVLHYMPVPPASYDQRSWQRWLFEQILLVERHEAMEFFTVRGEKPYAPHHGPGNDPYIIFDHGSDLDVRTSFRGEVNP